ncbi:MAG: methylmalonyl-CoA mutase family protein, partial [Terracidiphilus sp.]
QSLRTNAYNEAFAPPTASSARIARNTQIYLLEETGIRHFIDPWAGSYYVERLTHELMHEAWRLIQEVEELDGMAKAIETGLPRMRIEEVAVRRQAEIDSRRALIVGVNAYSAPEESETPAPANDRGAVREAQVKRLEKLKRERDAAAVRGALAVLEQCAKTGEGNLLECAVEAARKRATVGEISQSLENVWGRYEAEAQAIAGVYSVMIADDEAFRTAQRMVKEFEREEGRQPRILMAKMGLDGHDRGVRVIAAAFADIGFVVDIGPLFQSPHEIARLAAGNDVHVVGVSDLTAELNILASQLIDELRALGREDILVVVGGAIPPQDHDFLFDAGVAGIYGPGTAIPIAAQKILEMLSASIVC